MDVSVTARHLSLPQSARTRAASRLDRVARLDDRIRAADVVFEQDGADVQAEVRLRVPGDGPVIATGRASTWRSALDEATDRVWRRIKRTRGRRRSRRTEASSHEGSTGQDVERPMELA